MSSQSQGGQTQSDVYSVRFPDSQYMIGPDSLFTFRIEQEPLQLANVASALSAITRLHAKLLLIEHSNAGIAVKYAVMHDPIIVDKANLIAARITQNSPLTVVVVVSKALGDALASIIDAVCHTPIRYSQAKVELEQS